MLKNAAVALALPIAILSLGAVNALVPILIIMILVVAAAGLNRGYNVFNFFGISTMVGISPGSSKSSISGKSGFPVLLTFFGTLGKTSAGSRAAKRTISRAKRTMGPVTNTLVAGRIARRALNASASGGIGHASVGLSPRRFGRATMPIKKAAKRLGESAAGQAVGKAAAVTGVAAGAAAVRGAASRVAGSKPVLSFKGATGSAAAYVSQRQLRPHVGIRVVGRKAKDLALRNTIDREGMATVRNAARKVSGKVGELAAHPDTRKWLRRAKKAATYTAIAATGLGAVGYVNYRLGARAQHIGKKISGETKPTFREGAGGAKNKMGIAGEERQEARAIRNEDLYQRSNKAKEHSQAIDKMAKQSRDELREARAEVKRRERAGDYVGADAVARGAARRISTLAQDAEAAASSTGRIARRLGASSNERVISDALPGSRDAIRNLQSKGLGKKGTGTASRLETLGAAGMAVTATTRLARATNPSRNYKEAAEEHRTTKISYFNKEREQVRAGIKGEAKKVGEGLLLLGSPAAFSLAHGKRKYESRRNAMREQAVGEGFEGARAAGAKYISDRHKNGEEIDRRELRRRIREQLPGENEGTQTLFGRKGNRFREGRIKEMISPSQKPKSMTAQGAAFSAGAGTVKAAVQGFRGYKTQVESVKGEELDRARRVRVPTGPGGFKGMADAVRENAASGFKNFGNNQRSPDTAKALRMSFDMLLAGAAENKRLLVGTKETREELNRVRNDMVAKRIDYMKATGDERRDKYQDYKKARDEYSQVRQRIRAEPSTYKTVEDAMNRYKWMNIKTAKDPRLIDAYLAASASAIKDEKKNQARISAKLNTEIDQRAEVQESLAKSNAEQARRRNELSDAKGKLKEAESKKDPAAVASASDKVKGLQNDVNEAKNEELEYRKQIREHATKIRDLESELSRSAQRTQLHLQTKSVIADTKADVLSPEPELKFNSSPVQASKEGHIAATVSAGASAREAFKSKLTKQAENEGYDQTQIDDISKKSATASEELANAAKERESAYEAAKAEKDRDRLVDVKEKEALAKVEEDRLRDTARVAGTMAGIASSEASASAGITKKFAENANEKELKDYLYNDDNRGLVYAALGGKTMTYPKPARDNLDRLLDLADDDDDKMRTRAINLIMFHIKKGTFSNEEGEKIRNRLGDRLKFGERFGDQYAGKK